MACKLAKNGYYGGSPEKVLNAPVNVIFDIINYEAFEGDYSDAYTEMNKEQ